MSMVYSGDLFITSLIKVRCKWKDKMLAGYEYQQTEVDARNLFTTLPLADEIRPNQELENLLSNFSPETPCGDRQVAAKKIGSTLNPEALPAL